MDKFVRAHLQHIIHLTIIALCTILLGLPLFKGEVLSGHDAGTYTIRMVEYVQAWRDGVWFPRWAPDLAHGYGLPQLNFVPPLIYYLAGVFYLFGFGITGSLNLATFVLYALAGFTMYLFIADLFGRAAGLLSAVAYLTAPFVLVTLYVRAGLTDFSAYPFLPLAFWSVYRLSVAPNRGWGLGVALSVAGLLLASHSLSLMTLAALGLWLVWAMWRAVSAGGERASRFVQLWQIAWPRLWPLVLGVGLSAFFMLPAFVEQRSIRLNVLLQGYYNYHNHFVFFDQLFNAEWGYGPSQPGHADGFTFSPGWPAFGAVLIALATLRGIRAHRTWVLFLLLVWCSAIFMTLDVSVGVWERLALLQYFQFPWRFFSLAAFASSALMGIALWPLQRWHHGAEMGALVLSAILFVSMWSVAAPELTAPLPDDYFAPQKIAQGGMISDVGEYYAPWVKEIPTQPASQLIEVLRGDAQIRSLVRQSQRVTFATQATQPSELRLNIFYYEGWALQIDGNSAPIAVDPVNGTMRFSVPEGAHQIAFDFGETWVRVLGWGVSGVCLGVVIVISRWRTRPP